MNNSLPFSRKQFLHYTLMPDLLSRIKGLFGEGFARLSYFIALIFSITGLLAKNHIYLNPESYGQYGIRHVIAEAYRNLKFDRDHIDQVFIFFAIVLGLTLLTLQFIVLIFTILTTPAFAGFWNYEELFITQNPDTDLAFRMMYLVFGVDMFVPGGAPQPIHIALYALFEFYGLGILIVGSFIILYFTAVIIGETAQTGVPFGKRFTHAWVPVRLIIFFGLIIPLTDGLNGGQWITLSVAKYGSGLATNAWVLFNDEVINPIGTDDILVALPNSPEFQNVPAFMMIAKTCQWAVGRSRGIDVDAYIITGPEPGEVLPLLGTTYAAAVAEMADGGAPGGNVLIRFGELDEDRHSEMSGGVNPDCGEIILKTHDVSEPGSLSIQNGYLGIIQDMWAPGSAMDLFGRNYAFRFMSVQPREPLSPIPTAAFRDAVITELNEQVTDIIAAGVELQIAVTGQGIDPEIEALGWAGAAIWYNRIAEQNGAITAAAQSTPSPQIYPSVMEYIRQERLKNDQNVLPDDRFNPRLSDGSAIDFRLPEDSDIARPLLQAFSFWVDDTRTDDDASLTGITGNAFIDAINAVLGTQGLFDMCRNTDVHPLAQLSAVGRGMIEAAITNLAATAGFGIAGSVSALGPHFGGAAKSAAGFFGAVASIGLTVGFLLYYVLPFLPFIYFFFAVGGWVKSVFEAMVGIPLWALAHLRIDAEGIPGQAAASGYFLLFEIFIRPILIIFGLLASIIIFSAMVKTLNEIFTLAVTNIGGADYNTAADGGCPVGTLSRLGEGEIGNMSGMQMFIRGPIDEFFFTIMYAVIVYMMALGSFKLIDLIPNNISRWMGSSTQSFADDNEPRGAAAGFPKYATIGAGAVGSELTSAVGGIGEAGTQASADVNRRNLREATLLATSNELLPAQAQRATEAQTAFDDEITQAAANGSDPSLDKLEISLGKMRAEISKQERIIRRVEELERQGLDLPDAIKQRIELAERNLVTTRGNMEGRAKELERLRQ